LVAGAGCGEEPYQDSWGQTLHYEIEAAVDGHDAEIRHREEGGDWESFSVESNGDDEVTVDGEDIEVE
jgi:hypothetical protein